MPSVGPVYARMGCPRPHHPVQSRWVPDLNYFAPNPNFVDRLPQKYATAATWPPTGRFENHFVRWQLPLIATWSETAQNHSIDAALNFCGLHMLRNQRRRRSIQHSVPSFRRRLLRRRPPAALPVVALRLQFCFVSCARACLATACAEASDSW